MTKRKKINLAVPLLYLVYPFIWLLAFLELKTGVDVPFMKVEDTDGHWDITIRLKGGRKK